MKKSDFFLIAAVLAVSTLTFFLFHHGSQDGTRVDIFVDGELVRSEMLADATAPIAVESAFGSNTITIEQDGVAVTWANCFSQTCVHTGKISRQGEVIACLPHHLLITLSGGNRAQEDIDVIAR